MLLRPMLLRPRNVRFGSSTPSSSPYGDIHFHQPNWKGRGALPFQVKRRFGFVTFATLFALTGFSIPFLNAEKNIYSLRVAARRNKE